MPTPVPPPADSANLANSADALLEVQARNEAMGEELESLHELLAKPLKDILAERDKFQEAAAAWDAFGAMWLLSQRAMKRVALDLAAQQGVSAEEVVARALAHANDVLNGDAVDLGGIIAPAQHEHISRHRAILRKQFRTG
jgi:hypothetical protein